LGAVLEPVAAKAGAERAWRDWRALSAGLNAANKLLLAVPPGG
jgi:hypothetical protein